MSGGERPTNKGREDVLNEKCSSCRFFHPTTERQGECRLEPPSVHVIIPPVPVGAAALIQNSPSPINVSQWPIVQPDQWCGKYVVHPDTPEF